MKKNSTRNTVLAVLIGVLVWMLVAPDKAFSERENRNLASFPEITIERVFSGEFMSEFETYLTDQFPVRDVCIQLKTLVLRITGQRLINDYYLAEGGYLIPEESAYNREKTQELLAQINRFAEEQDKVNMSFLLAPTAKSIYEDRLPYTAASSELQVMEDVRETLSKKINYVDVYDVLHERKEMGMYYKTDHHWTTRAAFTAFMEYAKSIGIETDSGDYAFYSVTNDFQGTCASGSGIYENSDVVEICVPLNSEGTYVVNYIEEMRKTASLFESEKLEIKDKYQVFMGGNHAQVEIKTNAGTGRNLLLIKDSYGNCMVPMLTPHFDRIVVVDPRYFSGDIYEVMMTNKVNEVLFLYNVNSLVTDNSLDIMLGK